MSANQHILVTGGAGFIGSHLVERLLAEGAKVTVLDNFVTGRMDSLKEKDVKIVNADIREDGWQDQCSDVNEIYHLAALADIVPSIENPKDYYSTNVTGTFNVMEAARKYKVQRVTYVASSSCYGIPETYPTNEFAKISPQYPYALTKYLGEQTALHWGNVYKINVNSVRLFNVYGPRHRTTGTYGAVFGVFLAQRFANKPLTIVGDGSQTRDFTHVTDVVDALIKISASELTGEIFNVGSGSTYSVKYLAKLIGGESVNIPKRPGEPESTFADIEKIRNLIGWEPKVKFEDGVADLINEISLYKDAPVWTPDTIEKATQKWFEYLA